MAAMRPLAEDLYALQTTGFDYDGEHWNVQVVDAAQDWKMLLHNHCMSMTTRDSCTCGCSQEEFAEKNGKCCYKTDDAIKALKSMNEEVYRATLNSVKARAASEGWEFIKSPLATVFYQRHFDALHAEIAMSKMFLKLLTLDRLRGSREHGWFQLPQKKWTPALRQKLDKEMFQTRDLLRDQFGCSLNIMPENEISKIIKNPDNHEVLLDMFVVDPQRRDQIREILEQFSYITYVMRSTHPSQHEVGTFKSYCTAFGESLKSSYPTIKWCYYCHHLLEHGQEMMEEYGGIGLWSCEKSEASNKFIKKVMKNLARKNSPVDAAVDILRRLWWFNDPSIQNLAKIYTYEIDEDDLMTE